MPKSSMLCETPENLQVKESGNEESYIMYVRSGCGYAFRRIPLRIRIPSSYTNTTTLCNWYWIIAIKRTVIVEARRPFVDVRILFIAAAVFAPNTIAPNRFILPVLLRVAFFENTKQICLILNAFNNILVKYTTSSTCHYRGSHDTLPERFVLVYSKNGDLLTKSKYFNG